MIILAVVILLGITLFVTRKKRLNRQYDSQVTKYKSLSASYSQTRAALSHAL